MVERRPMSITIGATEVRNHLGKLLNRVYHGQEQLVIEKLGIPVAAIISMQDYADYRRLLAAQTLKELGRRMGAAAHRQGITEETLIEQMEEDRTVVYQDLYRRQA